MSTYIRPMSFGELFRSFFGVYKKAFWLLTLFTLGFIVFYNLVDKVVWNAILSSDTINGSLGGFIDLLMPFLAVGPILIVVSEVILGRKAGAREALQKGWALRLLIMTALLAVVFAFFANYLVNRILFFYWANFRTGKSSLDNFDWWVIDLSICTAYLLMTQIWIFFPMIVIVEKKGVLPAIIRSLRFLFLNAKNLLMIDLVMFFLYAVVLYPLDLLKWSGMGSMIPAPITLAIPIMTTISLIFYVLIYFETRARHENYSADELSQELGFAPLEEMMSM